MKKNLNAFGGLLRRWKLYRRKNKCKCSLEGYFVNFNQSPLSPYLFCITFKTKKGEKVLFLFVFYARFLSNNSVSRATTTMITTNKPTIAGTMYRSAANYAGASVGAGVSAAWSTANPVSAYDGHYPFVPWNVAMTVYAPSMSGFQL